VNAIPRQREPSSGPAAAQPDDRLLAAGIELPPAVTPFGAYVPAVQTGNLLFLSGMLPTAGHEPKFRGRLGKELNTEQGQRAAHAAALNALAVAKHHLGSLNRISQVVRLGVSIASSGEFVEHAKIADAASELLRDVFGPDKVSSRLVFGVQSLPFGVPVELEVIFEVAG
jgi:enamine deaminase RidA (YjgF/YER057c/UK114 family)